MAYISVCHILILAYCVKLKYTNIFLDELFFPF